MRFPLLMAVLLGIGMLFQSVAHATPADETLPSSLLEQIGAHFTDTGERITESASRLIENAVTFMGTRYRRGGASAEAGFDCSGFVQSMVERSVGRLLPRSAAQQAAATETVNPKDLQPGDLVFFHTLRRTFSHVGIYMGDGKFIHSPSAGGGVRVEDMHQAYWARRFDGARRVLSDALTGTLGDAPPARGR